MFVRFNGVLHQFIAFVEAIKKSLGSFYFSPLIALAFSLVVCAGANQNELFNIFRYFPNDIDVVRRLSNFFNCWDIIHFWVGCTTYLPFFGGLI